MDVVSILLANIHIGFISIDFSFKKSLSKAIGVQICTTFFVMVCGCTKDSTPKDPVDTLPPITQTGEDTFACLINGKPFFSTYKKRASYTISKGGYTIALSGSRQDDEGIKTVSLVGLDIEDAVSEIQYKLESENSGHFYGRYAIYDIGLKSYATTDENPGLLTITALNLEDGFISGVFEFIAEDEHGNTLNFTHGRFDLKF